ncbi:MAG: YfhO family protein [Lachnospiraceae bacterium]|nr:YfhO family protein [Lachnospiraceae bacterium]
MTKLRKNKKLIFYGSAFLLPFLLTLFLFLLQGIYPFGDATFLKKDFYQQYTPFFYEFHRRITSGGSFLYSWNAGLGANFLAIYVYYLASPFNFLSILLPESLILEFMTYMVVIKIGLCGLTMSYYLRRHFNRMDMAIPFFGMAYAFSGFFAAYNWNVMWMDVLFLAPLVILGLEKLVENGRPYLYCITLALSIYTNYYLSIMLCFYLVLYYLVLIVSKGFSIKAFLRFGWYSLLSGGFASILILPEIAALKFTTFTNLSFPSSPSFYMNPIEILGRHFVGVSVETGLDHWPNIYCGIIIFFLLPLYFLCSRTPLREKIAKGLLLLFLILSFDFNMLNFIWHGFNYPDSLPARQAYLYIILLLTMGCEAFLRIWSMKFRTFLKGVLAGLAAIVLILFLDRDDAIESYTLPVTAVFAILILVFFVLFRLSRSEVRLPGNKERLIVKTVVLIIFSTELCVNMCLTGWHSLSRSDYFSTFSDYRALNEIIETRNRNFSSPLSRAEEEKRKVRNHSMTIGYSSLSCFSSTNSGLLTKYCSRYGIMNSRVFYLSDGTTPFTAAMMGQHYTLVPPSATYLGGEDIATPLRFHEKSVLYKRTYTLPNGYVIRPNKDNLFIPAKDAEKIIDGEIKVAFSNLSPIPAQNSMFSALGGSQTLFHSKDAYETKDGAMTIRWETNGHLFVYNPKKEKESLTISFDDGSSDIEYEANKYRYIQDLGWHRKGTKAEIKSENLNIYSINTSALGKFTASVNSIERLRNIKRTNSSLTGSIEMKSGGNLVLTIPYEPGWRLYVDGEEKDILVFDGLWISTPLGAGKHDIELSFYPKGLNAGILLTLLSLLLIVLSFLIERRKRPRVNPFRQY